MITTWILVFQLFTTQGFNALSAVAPFDTLQKCNVHAAHLFQGWSQMQDAEDNHYHLLDSTIQYLELYEGEWVASWSCVPNIPYEEIK
jgi:hypothetical protein